jgi:hypothetical protein
MSKDIRAELTHVLELAASSVSVLDCGPLDYNVAQLRDDLRTAERLLDQILKAAR